jgi:hypothetical protein
LDSLVLPKGNGLSEQLEVFLGLLSSSSPAAQQVAADALQSMLRDPKKKEELERLPDFLSKVAGLLDLSANYKTQAGVVRVLEILCFGVYELVAGTSAFVKELIGRLGSSSIGVQDQSLLTLRVLAESDGFSDQVGEADGYLERLVGLLRSTSLEVQEQALGALVAWTDQRRKAAECLVQVNGCLESLLRLLWGTSLGVLVQALKLLKLLVEFGFSKSGEEIAQLPGSFKRLLELLESTSPEVVFQVTEVLGQPSYTEENQARIRKVPGCLEGLVRILGRASARVQQAGVKALHCLAEFEPENRRVIARVPGCLERLVTLLGCEGTTGLLCQLAEDEDLSRTIARVSGCLDGLVNLLGKQSVADVVELWQWSAEESAAAVLATLSADAANKKMIERVSGCLEKVVGVLYRSGNQKLQINAAWVLRILAEDAELKEELSRVPGCLTGLVGLLSASDTVLHVLAAEALQSLATGSAENGKEIACIPGCLEALESLRASKDAKAQEAAAGALRSLGTNAKIV